MSFEDPTVEEIRLLAVLIDVCEQYMPGSATSLDHGFMSAGEHAVHLLAKYGMVVHDRGGGAWTTKAKVVSALQDVELPDLDEVRLELRSVPDGGLPAVPPGARPHKHDVQLDFLRLWFPARAIDRPVPRPPRFGLPGPDRLNVEARLDLGDAMALIRGELLTIEEIDAFRDQLVKMVDGSKRSASLVAYRDSLQVHLLTLSNRTVGGKITISNPVYKHTTTCAVELRDVDLLKSTIEQFGGVLAKFNATA